MSETTTEAQYIDGARRMNGEMVQHNSPAWLFIAQCQRRGLMKAHRLSDTYTRLEFIEPRRNDMEDLDIDAAPMRTAEDLKQHVLMLVSDMPADQSSAELAAALREAADEIEQERDT